MPLVSLKAAAGGFSEEQAGFEERPEWAADWVTWDDHPKFEPGMFVARVQGHSMEPDIPSGSYCLFRPPSGGTRQGKKLLVRHAGISDPETGGQYTLKVYRSEKAADESGWQHTRITLEPLNPDFDPIILEPEDEGDVSVVAELVGALRQNS